MKFIINRWSVYAEPNDAQDQAIMEETFGLKNVIDDDGHLRGYPVIDLECKSKKKFACPGSQDNSYLAQCRLKNGHEGAHSRRDIYNGKTETWTDK